MLEVNYSMKEIDGKVKTIRQLLSGTHYAIDYYQREYKWQAKQVQDLIDDLTSKFLEDFDSKHPRKTVQKYGHYFLGSIITSEREGRKFIIDGQQRLTTLTLLLIYLHLKQGERADRVKLEDLIFSERYGERSFNLDVEERTPCMDVLYSGKEYDLSDASESIVNIVGRFNDIDGLFPEEINDAALPYFSDWLIDNVNLVEITAYSEDDAYLIFETMNDRGLSLSPLDMLKGYILSNIGDTEARMNCSTTWKKCIGHLVQLGKDEEVDAVKTWLRSQYAQSIRERKKGATPGDFDRLGTEFHRWIRDNHECIGLNHNDDFYYFIQRDLRFYTRQYLRLRKAAEKYTPGLEEVYYNARCDFTLQYPLLLAPLLPADDEYTIDRKLRMVASFIDILIARRAVNYLTLSYSAMSYTAFNIIKDIRGKPVAALAKNLIKRLNELDCDFNGTKDKNRSGMADFGLNQWSKRYIFGCLLGLPITSNACLECQANSQNMLQVERNASKSSISGLLILSDSTRNLKTRTISGPIVTVLAGYCFCRRSSTPAMGICPTRRNCPTIMVKTFWLSLCIPTATSTTLGS